MNPEWPAQTGLAMECILDYTYPCDGCDMHAVFRRLAAGKIVHTGGTMSKHKKIERYKELDRKRRRREKSLKLKRRELVKEAQAKKAK